MSEKTTTRRFDPVAAGIAILRYQLWDIHILINRTLVYGSLTALVVAIYVLIVGSLGTFLQSDGSLPVSLVGTGIVAISCASEPEKRLCIRLATESS